MYMISEDGCRIFENRKEAGKKEIKEKKVIKEWDT